MGGACYDNILEIPNGRLTRSGVQMQDDLAFTPFAYCCAHILYRM